MSLPLPESLAVDDDPREIHAIERAYRKVFVGAWRNRLAFLVGYPEGIPKIKNVRIAKQAVINGMDTETRVQIRRTNSRLQLTLDNVEFGLESVTNTRRGLDVPAYEGNTYRYERGQQSTRLNGEYSRSAEVYRRLGISRRDEGVDFLTDSMYPKVIDTRDSYAFKLDVDMQARSEVSATLGALVVHLTPDMFEEIPKSR